MASAFLRNLNEDICTTGDWDQATPLLPTINQEKTETKPRVVDDAEEEEMSNKSLFVSFAMLLFSIPALIGAWCWPALLIGFISGSVSAAARTQGHVVTFYVTLVLMGSVNGFMFFSLHRRIHAHTQCWPRYGPFLLTSIASVFIMADPLRHALQDETLHVADVFGLLCFWIASLVAITWYTAYTKRNFGVVLAHERHESFTRHVVRVSIVYGLILTASLLMVVSHSATGHGWSGSRAFTWQECGNNPTFSRVNATWTDACAWSSSQFKCTLPCCVPNPAFVPSPESLADCTCQCIPTSQENMAHLSPMGILFTIVCTYLGFVLLAVGTLWNANIASKWSGIVARWHQLRRRM